MTVYKEIDSIKKRLTNRAKKNGIWENFGQKEFRKLQDKYGREMIDDEEVRNAVLAFDEWSMNFTI